MFTVLLASHYTHLPFLICSIVIAIIFLICERQVLIISHKWHNAGGGAVELWRNRLHSPSVVERHMNILYREKDEYEKTR
jgi:hypothetical protein